EETLKKLADIALKNNLLIITDEIYEKCLYNEKKHISIASFSKEVKAKTIVVNGVSKSYAMTGWRIGYLASDNKEIITAIDNLQSHSTSNPATISQVAAIEALKTDNKVNTLYFLFLFFFHFFIIFQKNKKKTHKTKNHNLFFFSRFFFVFPD